MRAWGKLLLVSQSSLICLPLHISQSSRPRPPTHLRRSAAAQPVILSHLQWPTLEFFRSLDRVGPSPARSSEKRRSAGEQEHCRQGKISGYKNDGQRRKAKKGHSVHNRKPKKEPESCTDGRTHALGTQGKGSSGSREREPVKERKDLSQPQALVTSGHSVFLL